MPLSQASRILSDDEFANHADLVAGDADEVGTLCQTFYTHFLDAVAIAYYCLTTYFATIHVENSNLHLAIDTTYCKGDQLLVTSSVQAALT